MSCLSHMLCFTLCVACPRLPRQRAIHSWHAGRASLHAVLCVPTTCERAWARKAARRLGGEVHIVVFIPSCVVRAVFGRGGARCLPSLRAPTVGSTSGSCMHFSCFGLVGIVYRGVCGYFALVSGWYNIHGECAFGYSASTQNHTLIARIGARRLGRDAAAAWSPEEQSKLEGFPPSAAHTAARQRKSVPCLSSMLSPPTAFARHGLGFKGSSSM